MIRPAEGSDAAAIARIWNPVIRDTTITFQPHERSEAELRDWIAAKREAGHAVLVAERGGAIAGFGAYGQFRPGAGYRHTVEHTLMLAPEARGRGLGRALLGAVEAHARAGGAHSIWAGISAENPSGRTFHAACGFAEVARLPEVGFKFGRWIDLVLMTKRL